MRGTEGMNFKISTMGKSEVDRRRPTNLKPLTIEKVLLFIDSKQIDPHVKALLRDMAQNYPKNALQNWMKNFSKHLSKAQKLIRQKPMQPVDNIEQDLVAEEELKLPENNEFE